LSPIAHMGATATEILDRVRLTDILSGLGGDVPKRGNRTKCPIHRGDSLSFSIDETRGVWYCHRCAEGGGKLALVRRVLGYEPKAALEWISELTGVPLARWTREQSQQHAAEMQAAELEGRRLLIWRDQVVEKLRKQRELVMLTYYRAVKAGDTAMEEKAWLHILDLDQKVEWHQTVAWDVVVHIVRDPLCEVFA
jgi:CHC2 zinc finger